MRHKRNKCQNCIGNFLSCLTDSDPPWSNIIWKLQYFHFFQILSENNKNTIFCFFFNIVSKHQRLVLKTEARGWNCESGIIWKAKKIESETIPVELSAELCLGRKLNQVSFFEQHTKNKHTDRQTNKQTGKQTKKRIDF